MLYYAYGANTNLNNMAHRCPKAKVVSSLVLPDYRLVFKGVADIERANHNQVQGVLWDITQQCEDALDIFEGVKSGLYRKEYFCIKHGGEVKEVMFYKMNSTKYGEPHQFYFEGIHEGYRQNNLDDTYLFNALEANI